MRNTGWMLSWRLNFEAAKRKVTYILSDCLPLVACNLRPEGLQISVEPAEPVTVDDLVMTVLK
jgi:hypothetical protein